jgi:hypothetical protein
MTTFLENHSGEVLILILFVLVTVTLIVLVPQLLRAHLNKVEMLHRENMRALEQGLTPPPSDGPSLAAGRMALLVPMVVFISAGTVTCFLSANRSMDELFRVSLAIWTVAGVVSLAAITGGVALIGRLAQLQTGKEDEHVPDNPLAP